MNNISFNDIWKTPNLMSIFRIILIPIFLFLIFRFGLTETKYYVFGILALSWLTDILDGFIARRTHQVTELGKILDPVADKLTQVSILFAICIAGGVSWLIFGVIFVKEFIMMIGGIYLKKVMKTNIIPANYWGKAATGAFYVSIALVILNVPFAIYGIYATVILMLIAFITYARIVYNMMRLNQDEQKEQS